MNLFTKLIFFLLTSILLKSKFPILFILGIKISALINKKISEEFIKVLNNFLLVLVSIKIFNFCSWIIVQGGFTCFSLINGINNSLIPINELELDSKTCNVYFISLLILGIS